MKPARRKPRKLGQRRRGGQAASINRRLLTKRNSHHRRRGGLDLSHKEEAGLCGRTKRRAEAAAYGAPTQSPRRRRARRPGQTESLRPDRRRNTNSISTSSRAVRRGASSVDDDSAFEDSDELAAEAEIAELKAAIAAERAKGGV